MTTKRHSPRVLALFVAASGLAGCDQGKLGGLIGSHLVKSSSPVNVVVVAENTTHAATITARIPSIGAAGTLVSPGRNGDVETWTTPDQRALSYRQGVLVATRGLGFDLMAADVSGTLAALGHGGTYTRKMRYLNGNNQSVYLTFTCTMTVSTPQNMTINGVARNIASEVETCTMGAITFTNHYWMAGSQVVKATEWIGPELGYLTTDRNQN